MMHHNKGNLLYAITEAIVIMVIGLFVAVASLPVRQAGVFWIFFYLVFLLIVKIKSAEKNKISAHQLN